ncbi:uncharacterized protein LOC122503345 [Leptopilina heterotoma]|uniref:uncharacterized protein LOC122503345 n=1 Tax=Leptopilina heterotoma TaxID=63436 RepID=UPI001CA93A84|nr:uncharacterized protein LOC122503345 [Leptopilina heterotoma]XP_043469783.1 uncharacterized protein LOC122503345 [Leptopilina heterotoma]XP_043469784.1 uncharacterized protein LOC122503345 [Leptopilina heterotoma]
MASSSFDSDNNVPQWKRDLIRRRQGKVITSNGGGGSASSSRETTCGAAVVTASFESSPVAGNMRLEADVSLCSDSEDVLNSAPAGRTPEINLDKSKSENCDLYRARKVERKSDIFQLMELSKTTQRLDMTREINKVSEECESDSSEELQYGPGIVNKLKSKYLNLTLRETNKNRGSVQRFRRAASLEDLLDCEDDPPEKTIKRFTKKNVVTKAERYRNSARGNDSMKRARSVETLMRYNSAPEEPTSNRFGSIFKQEPVNDHIILIDRSSVKIESRLVEERPKAVNKPLRIKPVLAETERPPPDLVKTTMRIFEGSAKKLKPKGDVAAKVATFKTINDTYKAKNQKKIIPKPPLQPKPFLNGNNRTSSSPKKIILSQKLPTEKQDPLDEHRNEGVITEPIIQSVSSVVSKFQQIEKSLSPSPSPEPSFKIKFSPVPSPEPSLNKLKSSLEIKSPPLTPILSPRITSPSSPKKDLIRQNSSPVHKLPTSPSREFVKQISSPDPPKFWHQMEKENVKPIVDTKKPPGESEPNIDYKELKEHWKEDQIELRDNKKLEEPEPVEQEIDPKTPDEEKLEESECVDGPRTVSRLALDNISKAGTTLQFNFNNKSLTDKSHLPKLNGQTENIEFENKTLLTASSDDLINRARIQERLSPEKSEKSLIEEANMENRGSVGAISSLGLIRTVTMTTYPQCNESKTIRYHKSETISPPQKQIGIIRPLVSTKTQLPQQNLSNRELEKNLINRVKSIEQPTKVVVSLKSAEEIQAKKADSGGGLWDTKPWNQQNNTMVFNFSGRKDVPDYIENDGMNIKRKRDKPIVTEGGIIVLDATLDASTTDESDWEISGGPPSPCDVSFLNDNILINGRSNLSRQPRNHKHRIQFNDEATRTFEYPSEVSMLELEGDGSSVDGETSGSGEQFSSNNTRPSTSLPSLLGAGVGGVGGLATYTPSKVDLTSEGFELGVTRATVSTLPSMATTVQPDSLTEEDYLKPAQDAGAWGSETTADMLF